MTEVRFYKGKEPVEVLKRSKKNWLVHSLVDNRLFTTVPRLLWYRERRVGGLHTTQE